MVYSGKLRAPFLLFRVEILLERQFIRHFFRLIPSELPTRSAKHQSPNQERSKKLHARDNQGLPRPNLLDLTYPILHLFLVAR